MFPPLLVGALVSGAATVGSLVQHYRHQLGPMTLAEVRDLERLAPTPIAHCRNGYVKLVGVVGCDHPVAGLYGGVAVAAREVHHYTIEGRGLTARRVLVRVERSASPFWVEDDTGRITLNPAEARIDYESEGIDDESMLEEHRLRVGERVAVLVPVRRVDHVAQQPFRQAMVQGDQGLQLLGTPLVTWRTEPEVYPRLLPPLGGMALTAGSAVLAAVGSLLNF